MSTPTPLNRLRKDQGLAQGTPAFGTIATIPRFQRGIAASLRGIKR